MIVDPMAIGWEDHPLAKQFISELSNWATPRVLELGTKRWDPNFVSHHRSWVPDDAQYVMADIEGGDDVDLVIDAHDLSPWFIDGDTNAVISVAVAEHLTRPWIAFNEVGRVLAPGGLFYCQSHQSFVLHGYPDDRWRFTRESLAMMAEDAGLEVVGTSYTYPVRLMPQVPMSRWNDSADVEAYLCVDLLARKP